MLNYFENATPECASSVVAKASAALCVKMWISGLTTTYVRGAIMESPNEEDSFVVNLLNKILMVPTKTETLTTVVSDRDALVNRWNRICANDFASIPIGLIVLNLSAKHETLPPKVLIPATYVFVVARLAHTLFYAKALQPYRTLAYIVASVPVLLAAGSLFKIKH